MKRDATVTSEGDLGSRQKHASGLVIDKSKQIKHLRKTVGKKSRRQSTRKAGEQFPSTPSISSQLSTETRHSVRANGAVE